MAINQTAENIYRFVTLALFLPLIAACASDVSHPLTDQVGSAPLTVTENGGSSDLPEQLDPKEETIDCLPGISQSACLSLATITLVDEHPLYTMHYFSDYDDGLETIESLPTDTGSNLARELQWGCSLFTAFSAEENRLFGRNFDWRFSPAILLFTDPENGYASVSMVDYEYLGYTGDEDLTLLPLDEKLNLLQAPFLPFDGMNEHGLVIGMAAVPAGQVEKNPALETVGSLHIIRLMLDHAKNVPEAIALFSRFNVDMEGGPPIHYLLSDAAGRSALLEFYQGELVVIPTEKSWQEATNFLNAAAIEDPKGQCWRYDAMEEVLYDNQGQLTVAEAFSLLEAVSQPNTQWSIIYDLSELDLAVAMANNYDLIYDFQLMVP
jgi:hypothetical protein